MNRKQSLKVIETAYNALRWANLQDGFHDVAERLQDMNAKAERGHRKFVGGVYKLTVGQAAKLFTVRHLAEALVKPGKWTVADILTVRTECLYAQAYAEKHREEILKAWAGAGVDLNDILALDYAELVR